jgi:predicted  nucleic acid-binding Zn-ribbon protein
MNARRFAWQMDAREMRDQTAALIGELKERNAQLNEQLARLDAALKHKQLKIEQLTLEMATLKRWRYTRLATAPVSADSHPLP